MRSSFWASLLLIVDPDSIDSRQRFVCVSSYRAPRLEVLVVVHRSVVRIDQARDRQPLRLGRGGGHLLLLLLLFAVEVLVVLGGELLELDEEVPQMRLERRQVHPQVEAADNKVHDLLMSEIGKRRPAGKKTRDRRAAAMDSDADAHFSRLATCSLMNA